MVLTLDEFVIARKSGISVKNQLLARKRQEDILIINIFINNEYRDMIGRKRVFNF